MPPIPSRLPEEALALISATERRYKHLNEVEVPNLRRCIGPLSVQQTMAEDLRENTMLLTRQIQELEMMVEDQTGEKSRRELRSIVNDFQTKLESLRQDTRAALLASKRAIDSRSKSNKDELLAFSAALNEKQKSSNEKTTEDVLMKANSDVTDALRRTIALMQSELERSVLTTQMLDSSTSTLRSTSLQHDVLTSVMSTSKHLITALEKSDWLDRMLILSGFGFFLLVVLFIVKQRLVDRGIRMAFWWTRFVPSFGDDEALLMAAEKGMASKVLEVTSVVASLASSISIPIASILSSSISVSSLPEPSPVSSEALEPSPTPVVTPQSPASDEGSSVFQIASPTPAGTPISSDVPVHVEL